jgi:hypothetical protein
VQVLVKAGQRLSFKAYPKATNAHVLRTIVWTADMKTEAEHRELDARKSTNGAAAHAGAEQPVN